jgi:hypothetical protein
MGSCKTDQTHIKTYQDRPDPYQNLPRQTRPISKLTKTDQTHIETYQDRPDPYQNLPRQTRPLSKLVLIRVWSVLVSFDMGLVYLGKF